VLPRLLPPPASPRAIVLALSASALLLPAGARPNPRSETVQRIMPSAVRIELRTPGGEVLRSASGIAFASAGGCSYVLTNAHVVDPERGWPLEVAVMVLPARQRAARARVLAAGRVPDEDLAVLEVPLAIPAAALAPPDAPELGLDLVVIGAPFGKGLSVAAGIVSEVEYEPTENSAISPRPRSIKTDAAIGYGSSGGGVFEVPSGKLIGLVEGYRTARLAFGNEKDRVAVDVPMPGETFVAPAAKIRSFLATHGLGGLAAEKSGTDMAAKAGGPRLWHP